MYICLCRAVTRKTIEAAIERGADSVEEIGQRCGAGTECGKCQPLIVRLIRLRREAECREALESSTS